MRIGIDIDGVLTDFEKWQLDVGSKFFIKYNKNIVVPDGYDSNIVFNVSEELDYKFWYECLFDYAKNEPARKFSDEITKKLIEEGNEIYIITARYLTDKDTELGIKMKNIVIEWLNKYEICYNKIIFSPEEKLDVCMENNIDLMIEDNVNNINTISTKIPVICYNASYNKNCKGNNIYRCYSWYDIYHTINQIK